LSSSKKSTFGLDEDCDIMIDQVRAIDNKRLLKKIGEIDGKTSNLLKENLRIVLDLSS